MEPSEKIRENHRPDWLPIFLGVTSTFALMGVISLIGIGLQLVQFKPTDNLIAIVVNYLWLLGSVAAAMYGGGFITGLMLDKRGRLTAALDGLLMWEMTVIVFAAVGWFGYAPLPGVYFSHDATSQEALGWIAMQMGLPLGFAAAFGAISGNDYVKEPDEIELQADQEREALEEEYHRSHGQKAA